MTGDESERNAAGVQLMTSAYSRWQGMPPIAFSLPRQDAWILMVGLQAAVAHPLIATGPMSGLMESVGRRIQEAICDDPQVYAVAESGWNRAFDVSPSDA
ncbi:hypothetical protein [Actinacidiphila glaucinigra]|uniref:hypothetical protein n=1 Tax=Actinacidiphila glaucinigra TaxID=235986 RepID=UPI003D91E1CF